MLVSVYYSYCVSVLGASEEIHRRTANLGFPPSFLKFKFKQPQSAACIVLTMQGYLVCNTQYVLLN